MTSGKLPRFPVPGEHTFHICKDYGGSVDKAAGGNEWISSSCLSQPVFQRTSRHPSQAGAGGAGGTISPASSDLGRHS